MSRKVLFIIIILAAILIIALVVADHYSSRPGKRPSNPFAYDVSEYISVDPALIKWEETRRIRLDDVQLRAFTYSKGNIYLITKDDLQVIDNNGKRLLTKSLQMSPSCITVPGKDEIIVGFDDHIRILDNEGNIVESSARFENSTRFTSLAVLNEKIYVADGNNRRVLVFNTQLEQVDEFAGESDVSDLHGFIVPNNRFSVAVNPENELWITNPGIHALQNYTESGRLRSYIKRSSFGIEGFSGCCNPVHFDFLPGGRFVTSEKGIIRVKVLEESGELESVVAPPGLFEGGTKAPDVAIDDEGNIMVLDFDSNMIRVFERL